MKRKQVRVSSVGANRPVSLVAVAVVPVLAMLTVAVGCSSNNSASAANPPAISATSPATGRTGPATAPTSKILTIVVENHSLAQMRSDMPYLNGLAEKYGYATDYRAVAHPSLPNYLAIAFGSTNGVKDDRLPPHHHVSGDSVFSLASTHTTAGARIYAESMKFNCQRSAHYPYTPGTTRGPTARRAATSGTCRREHLTRVGCSVTRQQGRCPVPGC